MTIKTTLFSISLLALGSGGIALIACSSSDTGTTSPQTDVTSQAEATGPADTHCGTKVVTIRQAACTEPAEDEHDDADAGEADGGADHDHDTDGGAAAGGDDYGDTLFNAEGDDDDCKYHVKWTVSTIGQKLAQKTNANFTVVATTKVDSKPLTQAKISAEVFLDDTHPAPNSGQTTVETSTAGTYTVGPIQFDAPGKWTVRFHFQEECNDHEDSPHGHVAFYVQVP